MAYIALKLHKKSAGDLTLFARNINKKMKANTALFTTPPVDAKTLDTHIADLEDAESDMLHGSSLETEIRDEKRAVLEGDIRQLSLYVLQVSQGNAVTIRKAGMPLKAERLTQVTSLDVPSILHISSPTSGQVVLKWGRVNRCRNFVVEMCSDITAPVWQNAAFNSHPKASISGLKKASEYWFRVSALGPKGIQSAWSQEVSIVVR